MSLYQEVILLKHVFDGLFCVENVLPYYDYLVAPSQILGRHAYWANFFIEPRKFVVNNCIAGNTKPPKLSSYRYTGEKEYLTTMTGFDLERYSGFDKRKALRNAVEPEAGLHILNCAVNSKYKVEQLEFFEVKK